MKWLELSISSPPEFVEPLSEIFYRYGHGGVAIEEDGGYNPDEGETAPPSQRVTVKTYLPLDATTEDCRTRIDLGVRLVAHVGDVSPLQARELDEEEWQSSWKEHFYVLHVGQRIVICPTWREYTPRESDVVITLDPGMAFGTGHHPTTRMCLEQMERLVRPGTRLLDVGCGSGILSIAAAKLGASVAYGLEIDPLAVKAATRNAAENGVERVVHVSEGTLPDPQVEAGSYDVVAANVSAKVVTELLHELVRAVKPGGKIVASGIITEHRDGVVKALSAAGATVEETIVDADWATLVASR